MTTSDEMQRALQRRAELSLLQNESESELKRLRKLIIREWSANTKSRNDFWWFFQSQENLRKMVFLDEAAGVNQSTLAFQTFSYAWDLVTPTGDRVDFTRSLGMGDSNTGIKVLVDMDVIDSPVTVTCLIETRGLKGNPVVFNQVKKSVDSSLRALQQISKNDIPIIVTTDFVDGEWVTSESLPEIMELFLEVFKGESKGE